MKLQKSTTDNRTIAELLRDLTDLNDLLYGHRQRLRQRAPGKYPDATVYKVRRHRVKAHWRAGHVAVRLY